VPAVDRFRARFAGIADEERIARRQASPTPDDRVRAAIELDAFNIALAIEKVTNELGTDDREIVLAEVNRRRLASSPMPQPLHLLLKPRY
jgi:hypothetical protein